MIDVSAGEVKEGLLCKIIYSDYLVLISVTLKYCRYLCFRINSDLLKHPDNLSQIWRPYFSVSLIIGFYRLLSNAVLMSP